MLEAAAGQQGGRVACVVAVGVAQVAAQQNHCAVEQRLEMSDVQLKFE